MNKEIIVTSSDDDPEFVWLTDEPNLAKRERIITEAREHIEKGRDVRDVCARLTKAGFAVTRMKGGTE